MKTILVSVDFSQSTPRVLETARQLAEALRAAIHLVHVKEARAGLPGYPAAIAGYPALGGSEIAPFSGVPLAVPAAAFPFVVEPNRKEEERLAQWRDELTMTCRQVAVHEPTGAVVDEILKLADALSADLIVMGSHGHGAVYNLLVGSVTEGVMKRSTRPVLLVPSAPTDS